MACTRRPVRIDPQGRDGPPDPDPKAARRRRGRAGVHLVVLEGSRLLRLRGDELEEVVVERDDPFTDEVEVAPSGVERERDCNSRTNYAFPESKAEALDLFRAADTANGIAWMVGCDRTVLRVFAQLDPPRAERFALEPRGSSEPDTQARHFTAVRAICADDVIVGSPSRDVALNEELPTLTRIRSRGPLDLDGAAPEAVELFDSRAGSTSELNGGPRSTSWASVGG